MRRKLHNKARTKTVAYGSTINFEPGSGEVTCVVGQLTGALAFNIVDGNAEDGDILKLILQADGTERTVTLGGAQGKAGSVVIAIDDDAAVILIYNGISGEYASPVIPT